MDSFKSPMVVGSRMTRLFATMMIFLINTQSEWTSFKSSSITKSKLHGPQIVLAIPILKWLFNTLWVSSSKESKEWMIDMLTFTKTNHCLSSIGFQFLIQITLPTVVCSIMWDTSCTKSTIWDVSTLTLSKEIFRKSKRKWRVPMERISFSDSLAMILNSSSLKNSKI